MWGGSFLLYNMCFVIHNVMTLYSVIFVDILVVYI